MEGKPHVSNSNLLYNTPNVSIETISLDELYINGIISYGRTPFGVDYDGPYIEESFINESYPIGTIDVKKARRNNSEDESNESKCIYKECIGRRCLYRSIYNINSMLPNNQYNIRYNLYQVLNHVLVNRSSNVLL